MSKRQPASTYCGRRSGKAILIAVIVAAAVALGALGYVFSAPKKPPITSGASSSLTPEQETAQQAEGEKNLGKQEATIGDGGSAATQSTGAGDGGASR